MNAELIVTTAASWWQAEPDSHDRHLITAWALCTVGAAVWRLAVNATAPLEARHG
jgi:hypothetical protein